VPSSQSAQCQRDTDDDDGSRHLKRAATIPADRRRSPARCVRHAQEVTDQPAWTIFSGPERLRAEYRRLHGRMTDAVAFELPITEEAIDALLEAEGADYKPGQQLPMTAVSPELRDVLIDELTEGAYTLFEADSGRGASGNAVALEIMGHIADAGGVIAVSAAAYTGTQRIYQRLRSAMGRRPLISLGAAVHLAAADLVDRLGTTDLQVHGYGDARTPAPDASYSGEDHFFVVFAHRQDLHSYLVDARGRTHYLGAVARRTI